MRASSRPSPPCIRRRGVGPAPHSYTVDLLRADDRALATVRGRLDLSGAARHHEHLISINGVIGFRPVDRWANWLQEVVG